MAGQAPRQSQGERDHENPFAASAGYLDDRPQPLVSDTDACLRHAALMRPLKPGDDVLEVGVGTGWFLVDCALRGMRCSGLEINPVYRDHAVRRAGEAGLALDIAVGSIEDAELEPDRYDAIFALSVFEHVPDHERAIANVYRALAPGGVFYFNSTNKFALRSGEWPSFPLYGWLPDTLRRRIRVAAHGERLIESRGLDFHQFTYGGLRRLFEEAGFSRVADLLELMSSEALGNPNLARRAALRTLKTFPPLEDLARVFYPGTFFVCVK